MWFRIAVCSADICSALNCESDPSALMWNTHLAIFILNSLLHLVYLYLHHAASNPQECSRSCSWSNIRPHDLYISCSGGWEHAGVQNLTAHSCNHWGSAVPWVFLVIVLLSAIVIVDFILIHLELFVPTYLNFCCYLWSSILITSKSVQFHWFSQLFMLYEV